MSGIEKPPNPPTAVFCSFGDCPQPKAKKSKYCSKHKSQVDRKRYVEKAAFKRLREHAKERGIEFTLSFEYFEEWGHNTGYFAGKGNEPDSLTVDRVDPLKGYQEGNIKCLTRKENGLKGATTDKKIISAGKLKEVMSDLCPKCGNIFCFCDKD